MSVPDSSLILSIFLPASGGLLAYGPFPGIELIPYFFGLMAWAGLAFFAVFLSPIIALLRRLRRGRGTAAAEVKGEPLTQTVSESPGEGIHD